MVYKLLNEPGEYIDGESNKCNLLEATVAYTPEGVNVGWVELPNIETAMEYFGIKKIDNQEITLLANKEVN